ncbi:hypothetical protein BM86_09125, partial [Bacillus thuringiensis]|nr:hypothetical protein [Bacillus thuringiensis]
LLGIVADDHAAALAADEIEQHGLAGRFQLARLQLGCLDDVRVERAAQTAIRRGHDQQMDLILAGSGQQL